MNGDRYTILLVTGLCLIVVLGSAGPSSLVQSRGLVVGVVYAQSPPFYQGKTIRVIVGSDSGGLYDLWARLFAKHMPKHIPVIRI